MGKRYYCDYCDRHFVDDLEARKKHLAGVMHMRLRKEYYDKFKDAETKYKEEIVKTGCKRYLRFGDCAFGSHCRYTHYSHEELEVLRQQAEMEKKSAENKKSIAKMKEIPTLASWLEKRNKTKALSTISSHSFTTWDVPSNLIGRPNLPPSLQPWRIEDFTYSDFDTWG